MWGLLIWIPLYMPTFRADLDGDQVKQEGTAPTPTPPKAADISSAGILETCHALRKLISKNLKRPWAHAWTCRGLREHTLPAGGRGLDTFLHKNQKSENADNCNWITIKIKNKREERIRRHRLLRAIYEFQLEIKGKVLFCLNRVRRNPLALPGVRAGFPVTSPHTLLLSSSTSGEADRSGPKPASPAFTTAEFTIAHTCRALTVCGALFVNMTEIHIRLKRVRRD